MSNTYDWCSSNTLLEDFVQSNVNNTQIQQKRQKQDFSQLPHVQILLLKYPNMHVGSCFWIEKYGNISQAGSCCICNKNITLNTSRLDSTYMHILCLDCLPSDL